MAAVVVRDRRSVMGQERLVATLEWWKEEEL